MDKYRKKLYLMVIIASIIVAFISGTFAYFTASISDNDTVKGGSAKLDFDLNITKVTNDGLLVPIADDLVIEALQNKCLFKNDGVLCQVYEITLINSSSIGLNIDGIITLYPTDGSSIQNVKWSKLIDASTYDDEAVINNMDSSNLLTNHYIESGATEQYYIIIWDSELDSEQITDIGDYYGEMLVTTADGKEIKAEF